MQVVEVVSSMVLLISLPFSTPVHGQSQSTTPFSASFQQPPPPLLKPAFKAHWNQHKWDESVSHIAAGYMYSSPSAKKVRVDETYDSTLGSSLFDYNNVTDDGRVSNTLWTLSPSLTSTPLTFRAYVDNPGFPLIEADLLVKSQAVFAGTSTDPYVGELTKWNILYAGSVPVTMFVDGDGVIHEYDIWSPVLRTFVITRLFDIVVGDVPGNVFDFPE